MELGGWWYFELSFAPNPPGFSPAATLYLDADMTDLLTSTLQIKIKEGTIDDMVLGGNWYQRPLRLSARCEFKKGEFYRTTGEFRYWQDPWELKLKSELRAGEPPTLSFTGDYSGEGVKLGWEALFADGLALDEAKGYLEVSVSEAWSLRTEVGLEDKTQSPTTTWKVAGNTSWGKLSLQGEGANPGRFRCYREFKLAGWQHEVDFDWTIDDEPELSWLATRPTGEDRGYGVKVWARGWGPIELRKLAPFLFWGGWRLSLDAVTQAISLRGTATLQNDNTFSVDLAITPDGLEGDLWLDAYLGDVELTLGGYWYEDQLDELYLELYLEF